MGPVVNQSRYESMLRYIEIGKQEGRLVAGGNAVESPEKGYYVEPTIFSDIAPQSRLAQEEIFGPVLAMIRSKNFKNAMEIANNTEFGLTGAIYTSSREKLAVGRRIFMWVICISTVNAPARWWERTRSAASTCREQIPRRGAGLPVPVYASEISCRKVIA